MPYFRFLAMAVQPGEQPAIGHFQPVPDLFDLAKLLAAIGGKRGFRQPRRHPDPQPAGGQLDHRPSFRRFGAIEKVGNMGGETGLGEGFDITDKPRHARKIAGIRIPGGRPDQRDGFCQIAHIVIGHQEQFRIDTFHGQLAERAGLQVG